MATCFRDYVTFQLSRFYDLQFQRFPYFANWISNFKENNFWVTLADFDKFCPLNGKCQAGLNVSFEALAIRVFCSLFLHEKNNLAVS